MLEDKQRELLNGPSRRVISIALGSGATAGWQPWRFYFTQSRFVGEYLRAKRQTPATIIAAQSKGTAAAMWAPVRLCWNQGRGLTAIVRWVEAVPLGTSYDGVARRIWEIAEESQASEVWMDGTGVGIAVKEMVEERKPPGVEVPAQGNDHHQRTSGQSNVSATSQIKKSPKCRILPTQQSNLTSG